MRAAASRLWASMAGLSPEAIALVLAVGVVLGVFPVFGAPTLLCLAAAVLFRLNLPALQLVNQVTAPLQWALLIPFARIGARIAPGGAWSLAGAARYAVTGWICLSVPLGILIYAASVYALRRCHRQCFNSLESPG